ncbi:hypothetical protein XENOCAPTIV_027193, partial [Xenoophorus captivus]
TEDAFWDQFWADTTITVQDVFALVPAAEIRAVREESPSNLATLCYKTDELDDDDGARPLAESLLLAIADLLFYSSCFSPRHALPLFTSLLNVVCAYDPVGYGIPYNHLLFADYREQLVEQAVQILIVTLEHDGGDSQRGGLFIRINIFGHILSLQRTAFRKQGLRVSPYLKSLSMVAANKLLHLLEAFSTTWFLFSAAQNHHLVFFLLEAFNNIIQYQFDGKLDPFCGIVLILPLFIYVIIFISLLGNCNLVYAIIRKRNVFHQLANLPSDPATIQKALQRKKKSPDVISRTSSQETVSMEGSHPAVPAEPGTLKASLVAIPGIDKLTEKSQVSEDGTMVSVPKLDSQQTVHSDQSAAAGTSDTESNSGRDNEVSGNGKKTFVKCLFDFDLGSHTRMEVCFMFHSRGLTDESEILKFLQHGTLVGLLPVPHPILIRKYQANAGTAMWFRTYMWGVVYLR